LTDKTVRRFTQTHTSLPLNAVNHIERLVKSWHFLSDLAFADLLLHVPVARSKEQYRTICISHVRSLTGQTPYEYDPVGLVSEPLKRTIVQSCFEKKIILEEDSFVLGGNDEVRIEAIPVTVNGIVIAVATREFLPLYHRRFGNLERTYLDTFEKFAKMISLGLFPYNIDAVDPEDSPRVGDGVMVLNSDTQITFSSPNAVSTLRILGVSSSFHEVTLEEIGLDSTYVRSAIRARNIVTNEVSTDGKSVLFRFFPLFNENGFVGMFIMLRDVTSLRKRDRLLQSKEATIKEVHHRVKNNLQTIAALLRLQRRRMKSEEAKEALQVSESRIRAIGVVHEILAQEAADFVPFVEIIEQLVNFVTETLQSDEYDIRFQVSGDPGFLPGEVATPLSVVMNECIQNCIDHAFPANKENRHVGEIDIEFIRNKETLVIVITDNGVGLPKNFNMKDAKGLGLNIVKTLVESELGGEFEMESDFENGSQTRIVSPVAIDAIDPDFLR
jgi:two-component sensor histidine kinase